MVRPRRGRITKTGQEIRGLPNAFMAANGIKTGSGNRIPLWLFVLELGINFVCLKEGYFGDWRIGNPLPKY